MAYFVAVGRELLYIKYNSNCRVPYRSYVRVMLHVDNIGRQSSHLRHKQSESLRLCRHEDQNEIAMVRSVVMTGDGEMSRTREWRWARLGQCSTVNRHGRRANQAARRVAGVLAPGSHQCHPWPVGSTSRKQTETRYLEERHRHDWGGQTLAVWSRES